MKWDHHIAFKELNDTESCARSLTSVQHSRQHFMSTGESKSNFKTLCNKQQAEDNNTLKLSYLRSILLWTLPVCCSEYCNAPWEQIGSVVGNCGRKNNSSISNFAAVNGCQPWRKSITTSCSVERTSHFYYPDPSTFTCLCVIVDNFTVFLANHIKLLIY